MRKRIFMLLAVLALALTAAAALSACGNGQEPADLSGDVSFSLQSVCGEDLENGAVTLTTAQYEALKSAEDKTAQCEYELAAKASVSATLNDKTLTFAVTAEDGTKKEYAFALTVLSNDVSLTVTKISGAKAENGAATLTTAQYEALKSAEDKTAQCEYELAAKASVSATLNDKTLTFAVTAEDGTQKTYSVTLTVLSDDTSLTIAEVNGAAVSEGKATLTTAQYEALVAAQDKAELCEYTLATGASITVALDGKTLTFAVTAEDGTQKTYSVTLTVLSNDISFVLHDVCGAPVIGDSITMTEEQYRAMRENVGENSNYSLATGASLTSSYDTDNYSVEYFVVSEDGTAQNIYTYFIKVSEPFGSHALSGYGGAEYAEWDFSEDGYVLEGNAAILNADGNNVSNYYIFGVDVAVQDLTEGCEVVFMAYQQDDLMIRFALRGEGADSFKLFSDYKDRSDFKNYTKHRTGIAYAAGEFVRFEVVCCGNSLAMLFEGEVIYRLTLDSMSYNELCVSSVSCRAVLKNLSIADDRAAAEAYYAEALSGYKDKTLGVTLLGSSENISKFEVADDGTITVLGKDLSARVMAAPYIEGVPVGGYEYAVSGSVKVTNTKTSGAAASKVEFQIYKDINYFIKFHLFRFPTNNSFYTYPTIGGQMSNIATLNKTMPSGTEYTLDYIFVYDNGTIEVWLKDGTYMVEYTCVYTLVTDWGYTGYAFAMRQYCDTVWTNFAVHKGDAFDALMQQLHGAPAQKLSLSANLTEFSESLSFISGANGTFQKTLADYDKAFVFMDDVAVSGAYWMASGTLTMPYYEDWGQCELQLYVSDTQAVRYVFEYVPGGKYQVFTENKNGDTLWQKYNLVRSPQENAPAILNFTIVNCNNVFSFLIDGKVWHSWDASGLTDPALTLGGQNCTMKVSRLYVETDQTKVEEFAANMEEYEYASPYESRIASLAAKYADAEKGGVLLAGSSTIDFWDTWQEDIGTDTLGYNVGIGGTIVEDWLYAYDRLIAPFNPSKIVLFLGGNNVNNQGDTGEYTAELLAGLLEKMHADFPEAEIYYVLSLPVPNNYSNGKYTVEYGRLIECMKQYGAENEWLTVIDMESSLVKDGNPIPEYFRSDGVHLTEAGYAVWSEYINRIVLPKES